MRSIGRYQIHREIASGGMATIYLGVLPGPFGFARTVAIKQLHRHLLGDAVVRAMFVDEARIASRISHPSVVPVLDVVHEDDDVFLVMDYVHGESLARALVQCARVPAPIASAIVIDGLRGLHAAHELRDPRGELLNLVHRDVSPHNLLVGADGTTRLVDFGIAKARDRIHSTQGSELRGKVPYMAPEQVLAQPVDRRADVWAAGVVLWEALTGHALFHAESAAAIIHQIVSEAPPPPSSMHPDLAPFDALLRRVLCRSPDARIATAAELADAIAEACRPASAAEVARWLVTSWARRSPRRNGHGARWKRPSAKRRARGRPPWSPRRSVQPGRGWVLATAPSVARSAAPHGAEDAGSRAVAAPKTASTAAPPAARAVVASRGSLSPSASPPGSRSFSIAGCHRPSPRRRPLRANRSGAQTITGRLTA